MWLSLKYLSGREWASLVAQSVENLSAMQETQVPSLVWEDPLEKEMATHSSILAWRIPGTEEPGGLRVPKSWTRLSHTHTHTHTHSSLKSKLQVPYSVQFSRLVVSDSLRPHELQHARPPCPSPTPGVHSNSRPLTQ